MKIIAGFLSVLILGFAVSCASTTGGGSPDAGIAAVKPVQERREAVKTKERVFFAQQEGKDYTAGALDEYTVFEWNPGYSNLLLETRYSASGAALEKVEYTYQGNSRTGKTTKVIVTVEENRRIVAQEQIRTQVEYTYAQDRLQKETIKNKDGNVITVYEYTYDDQGNLTGRIWKNGKDLKLAETVNTWTDGKLTASETRNAGGNQINATVYQYDPQGNLVKQENRSGDGKITSVLNVSWQNGLEVKSELLGADNAVQQRETNTYGPDGEVVQKTIENVPGKSVQIVQYEYEFK